jgi:hypothetical protein
MSLIDFQHLHQQIKDKLFEISYKIECFNKVGDNDLNRYAEVYFKNILNIIYSDKGWFFEKAVKINQDTYDLYDKTNKVCVQVTSNKRKSKKTATITKFEKYWTSGEYTTLVILFTSNSKPNGDIPSNNFSYLDYDITEFSSLIERICNQSQLLQIRDILVSNPTLLVANSIQKQNSTRNSIKTAEEEFLRNKKLEQELTKELVSTEYWKHIDREELSKYPYKKFKDSRFILRSIEDQSYPNVNDDSNWSRTFMYDFYEKGILIWLDALFGTKVIMNENEQWYVEDFKNRDEPAPKGSVKINIRILGKLPYANITYWQDGDEYYNDYHLFCKYIGVDNSPYEEIIYKYENRLGYFWDDLDLSKQIK